MCALYVAVSESVSKASDDLNFATLLTCGGINCKLPIVSCRL
jgi:hypothetical protein